MWPSRGDDDGVVCIACGEQLPRGQAREYDKHGDRWDRQNKSFEYLCKDCHSELSHQPRGGLEALLTDVEDDAAADPGAAFLSRYWAAVERRDDPPEEER